MIIIKMSEEELNALWDQVEAKHPLGPMAIGDPEPSKYLLKAYELGLLTWDQALEMHMASIGVGMTDP